MGTALLLDYYIQLPEPREGEDARRWEKRLQEALEVFQKRVGDRYTEGTLLRLLDCRNAQARRAAALALGLLGGMNANAPLAARLHDDDLVVRQLAADALWTLWFRADREEHNVELQRVLRLRDNDKALAALDALIGKAPNFAEAYNQRAILHFKMKEYQKSIADCEKAIQLNPHHFGAYAGMAQCHMSLRKPRAALKAFRAAHKINPNMQGVEETIRDLENVLGEEGKK